MKTRWLVISLLSLVISFAPALSQACGMVETLSGKYIVQYQISPYPVKVGASLITYEVMDLEAQPVSAIEKASTKLWMPSMDHGSRPMQTFQHQSSGRFETRGAYFVMGGVWEIIGQLEMRDGSTETFKIPVIANR